MFAVLNLVLWCLDFVLFCFDLVYLWFCVSFLCVIDLVFVSVVASVGLFWCLRLLTCVMVGFPLVLALFCFVGF